MNKRAQKATLRLLKDAGFSTTHRYDRMAFGSWLIELSSKPALRVVWDGKDGWLIVQQKTDEIFNNQPVWKDLRVVKDAKLQTAETALSLIREALAERNDRKSGQEGGNPSPTPDFEKRATAAYLEARKAFSAILLRHDPMLIGEGVPDDEYDHEATKLLAKFKDVASLDDAEATVGDFFSYPESEQLLPDSWRPWRATCGDRGRRSGER